MSVKWVIETRKEKERGLPRSLADPFPQGMDLVRLHEPNLWVMGRGLETRTIQSPGFAQTSLPHTTSPAQILAVAWQDQNLAIADSPRASLSNDRPDGRRRVFLFHEHR